MSKHKKDKIKRKVAIALMTETRNDVVAVAFRGATRRMVEESVQLIKCNLCRELKIREVVMPHLVNGKCYREFHAVATGADKNRLSPAEWLTVIKGYMEQHLGCKVNIVDNIERFLNL